MLESGNVHNYARLFTISQFYDAYDFILYNYSFSLWFVFCLYFVPFFFNNGPTFFKTAL